MVTSYDFLDLMAWTVAISGFLLAAIFITLRNYSSQTEEKNKPLRYGFAVSIGACGLYLFLSGVVISLIWPFAMAGGAYNVLFGGIATLDGSVLLDDAVTLFLNADLRPVSYLAAVAGLYAAVDA
jgi:uncharacterized membrane protein